MMKRHTAILSVKQQRQYKTDICNMNWCSFVSMKWFDTIMCILFIYRNPDASPESYRLILASNRDENIKRPTLPAHYWKNHPQCFGGMSKCKYNWKIHVTLKLIHCTCMLTTKYETNLSVAVHVYIVFYKILNPILFN